MRAPLRWLPAAALAVFSMLCTTWLLVYFYAPVAQCEAGCRTQKIFYFHVPSAYLMYVGIGTACLAGALHLWSRRPGWDALAQAGGELAVAFSAVVLTTGPLWGRKAWGHYWVWDPRLTTTLLVSLLFVAYLVLRAGGGEAEKRFSSALAVLGSMLVPVIHYSVRLWRGQHPTVISRSGGGLQSPAMTQTLLLSFLSFTLLAALFLFLRSRQLWLRSHLETLRADAHNLGLLPEEQ